MQAELAKGDASNPFLYPFYLHKTSGEQIEYMPGKHIGIIYASIRASLARGESASLLVEVNGDQDPPEVAEIEIEINRRSKNIPQFMRFFTGPSEPIYFGGFIRDVDVIMPKSSVKIGNSNELVLFAPVSIQCQELVVAAERVIADASPSSQSDYYLSASRIIGRCLYVDSPNCTQWFKFTGLMAWC